MWILFVSKLTVLEMWCQGGSRISQTGGANPIGVSPTYYLAKFSQKLHDIKKFKPLEGASLASTFRESMNNLLM